MPETWFINSVRVYSLDDIISQPIARGEVRTRSQPMSTMTSQAPRVAIAQPDLSSAYCSVYETIADELIYA